MKKIVVIGCGMVGMSYVRGLCHTIKEELEISIIDLDSKKVMGEVLDLNQASILINPSILVKEGKYEDCNDADIIVITVGPKKVSDDRLNDVSSASKIVQEIALKIAETSFSGIFLVATNPVDVISEIVSHYTGYSYHKTIGVGTMLDTIRLKSILKKEINISSNDISCYVLGEHGNSSFVAWTNANIGLQNLKSFMNSDTKEQIEEKVRKMGTVIANLKGNTSEGIASCLITLTKTILYDEKRVYPVSHYQEDYDVYFSTPVVIGKDGILKEIVIKLSQDEEQKLKRSAQIIKEAKEKVLPIELY